MSVVRMRAMVEPAHHRLSISAQCRLLRISRSSYYYAPVPETDETLALMTVIDATFLDYPWYGAARWRGTCGVPDTSVGTKHASSAQQAKTGKEKAPS
jgi:putative transposase